MGLSSLFRSILKCNPHSLQLTTITLLLSLDHPPPLPALLLRYPPNLSPSSISSQHSTPTSANTLGYSPTPHSPIPSISFPSATPLILLFELIPLPLLPLHLTPQLALMFPHPTLHPYLSPPILHPTPCSLGLKSLILIPYPPNKPY